MSTTFYECCEHCRWDTPQPHHHVDRCTTTGCVGAQRQDYDAQIVEVQPRNRPFRPVVEPPLTLSHEDIERVNEELGKPAEVVPEILALARKTQPKKGKQQVTEKQKDNLSRYHDREVELTRDDDKVFTGKAIVDVTAGLVRLMTGKRGRPPVVSVEHIKKIKLA